MPSAWLTKWVTTYAKRIRPEINRKRRTIHASFSILTQRGFVSARLAARTCRRAGRRMVAIASLHRPQRNRFEPPVPGRWPDRDQSLRPAALDGFIRSRNNDRRCRSFIRGMMGHAIERVPDSPRVYQPKAAILLEVRGFTRRGGMPAAAGGYGVAQWTGLSGVWLQAFDCTGGAGHGPVPGAAGSV